MIGARLGGSRKMSRVASRRWRRCCDRRGAPQNHPTSYLRAFLQCNTMPTTATSSQRRPSASCHRSCRGPRRLGHQGRRSSWQPRRGGRSRKRYFAGQWQEAAEAAGIVDLHFHDLPGRAVTMLVRRALQCSRLRRSQATAKSTRSRSWTNIWCAPASSPTPQFSGANNTRDFCKRGLNPLSKRGPNPLRKTPRFRKSLQKCPVISLQ